jgi:hypothetical protein
MPDVLTIVRDALRAGGYDGLYSDVSECACLVDHLEPCGDMNSDCRAGYKRPGCDSGCGEGCDFHVVEHRPVPWDDGDLPF